jgi:hypothetical protein
MVIRRNAARAAMRSRRNQAMRFICPNNIENQEEETSIKNPSIMK